MDRKIIIGITQGDADGVGYEVIIKSLTDARMLDLCVPVVYGSSKAFGFYKKQLPDVDGLNTNIINTARDYHPKRVNIINCVPDNFRIDPGQPTPESANAALVSLKEAVKDLKNGDLDALVTAPLNKKAVALHFPGFTGHTEYLVNEFGVKDGLMFLIADKMRVGVVTNHLPLSKVSSALSVDKILSKLRLMNESLKRDFGIIRPKIAVLGLNPHSGDGGLLGSEEIEIINPAVEAANAENILAFGAYSPDGFFSTHQQYTFDAVLAMYHDQGLIPFKALAFDTGVNFTAGLPVVRTSPDHGTAYELAGKNMANPMPMKSAIYAAIDIVRNRWNYDNMRENMLRNTSGNVQNGVRGPV
ncbi:MAG TPA: 4-hydroxythreonine-4-phosphate dehydrogenase PdxA [Candidatus Coprenecus stercoravium]|uniref:4-hydroxythreonine-4-phosphate dehydrogenase PdxA n=1 Tax=Candidatus Coprenecus stercoravium TaxID=2840735 RepID=A0A9D2GPD8_9BACT|nr:4-hydroxythreonine-4-phosphate dehydrogenase PdxA [Candidatus Coprenecus stercoravium]